MKLKINEYIICDNFCVLKLFHKKYGSFNFLIDIEDIQKCKEHNWSVCRAVRKGWNNEYFYGRNTTNRNLLHRFLTDCPSGMVVDHINQNTLDNRKNNLRICLRSTNCVNKKIPSHNTTGVRGVSYWQYGNCSPRWCSKIDVNRKRIYLGYFINKEDAIKARKSAELKYFGQYLDN